MILGDSAGRSENIFSANSQMGRHGSVYDLIIETEQTQTTSYEKIG